MDGDASRIFGSRIAREGEKTCQMGTGGDERRVHEERRLRDADHLRPQECWTELSGARRRMGRKERGQTFRRRRLLRLEQAADDELERAYEILAPRYPALAEFRAAMARRESERIKGLPEYEYRRADQVFSRKVFRLQCRRLSVKEGGIGDYIPKPKWMRWRTYERRARIEAAEEINDASCGRLSNGFKQNASDAALIERPDGPFALPQHPWALTG